MSKTLRAIAELTRCAVHFDNSDRGDIMRTLAVNARQQHDKEQAVIEAARVRHKLRQDCAATDDWDAREGALWEADDALAEAVEVLSVLESKPIDDPDQNAKPDPPNVSIRRFRSYAEAAKAYGWTDADPMALHARRLFTALLEKKK